MSCGDPTMCDCCFRKIPNKSIGNTIGFKNQQLAEIKLYQRKRGRGNIKSFVKKSRIPLYQLHVNTKLPLGGLRIFMHAFIKRRTSKSIGNTIGFNYLGPASCDNARTTKTRHGNIKRFVKRNRRPLCRR